MPIASSFIVLTMLIIKTQEASQRRSRLKLTGEENKKSPFHDSRLIEGDILLPNLMSRRAGLKDTDYRWPRKTILYDYADHVGSETRKLVVMAINHIKIKTKGCLRFNKRKKEQNYVLFTTNDTGCYAHAGYWGWKRGFRQKMNVATNGCELGQIIHELLHVAGFMHEQSRPDRDDYVEIKWENILEETKGNFQKMKKSEINSFKSKYDYNSIMHYGANFFSKNGQDTIVTKDGSRIGQRDGLSEADAKQIRLMYGCK